MNFYELNMQAKDGDKAYREFWSGSVSIMLKTSFWYFSQQIKDQYYTPCQNDLMTDDWILEKKKERQVLVIEDVKFYENDFLAIPTSGKIVDWLTLVNNPKMKMTLEWEE